MSVAKIEHPSVEERKANAARQSRKKVPVVQPRGLDAGCRPPRSGRAARGAERDPRARPGAGAPRTHDGLAVHVLPRRGEDHGRRPEGHADGPASTSQLCGDAHLSNFGVFASPERTLLFDLNDFDETLPGPFEYDVKRMAASFTIAARNNGFTQGRRARRRRSRRCGPTGRRWPSSRRCARWTSGTRTCPRKS